MEEEAVGADKEITLGMFISVVRSHCELEQLLRCIFQSRRWRSFNCKRLSRYKRSNTTEEDKINAFTRKQGKGN